MKTFLGLPLNCSDALQNIGIMLDAGLVLGSSTDNELNEIGVALIEMTRRYSSEVALASSDAIKNDLVARKTIKHDFTPLNSFAARLKMALVHTKTTQADLAWAINVSQSTISQIVTGKVIEAGIVRTTAIAEALGVRVNWLLYGEGEMYSKQPESLESQIARLKFSGSNS